MLNSLAGLWNKQIINKLYKTGWATTPVVIKILMASNGQMDRTVQARSLLVWCLRPKLPLTFLVPLNPGLLSDA